MIIGLDSFLIQNFLYSIGGQAFHIVVARIRAFSREVQILSLVWKVFLVCIIANLLSTIRNLRFFQSLHCVSHLINLTLGHVIDKSGQTLIMSLNTSVQMLDLFIVTLVLLNNFLLVLLHTHLFALWSIRWWKQYAFGITSSIIEKSIILIISIIKRAS